jgi:hypothetical protein
VTPTPPAPIAPTKETAPFTNGLINPGLNPGFALQGANQPFYATTNPVQNTYYWGAHPYMLNMGDLSSYNNVPTAPATPWGLQNYQTPTYNAQGLPVYPAPSAPATRAATGPGTTQQQLEAAWNSGDYAAVNNLVKQNNITTTQAQTLWGVSPAQAAAVGVNLIQPVGQGPATITGPGTTS